MNPSPIPRVLSTFRRHRVKALLMGGQACILYGAAEFSRDIDFAVAVSPGDNLGRLRRALNDLRAVPVYVPPLEARYLRRGHACHFRCGAAGVKGLRIDLMSRMRGAPAFGVLWRRRTVVRLRGVGGVEMVSLPDLVRIKKTQRDKDWVMLRRLVEVDCRQASTPASRAQVRFWLMECRSPELLSELAGRFGPEARTLAGRRKALAEALRGRTRQVERCLRNEEDREREADRSYWAPLRRELERWRLGRR